MNYEVISFDLEQKLSNELNELFESNLIKKVLKTAKVNKNENIFKNMLEGQSFRINSKLSPDLFSLCTDVVNILEFEEPINFFIVNSSETNASAYPKIEDDEAHMIILTSSLIEKFSLDELKFIIGHEIGHLISKSASLERIIRFVFPNEEKIPSVILNKIRLWRKLAELTADRYGFIASRNLDNVITVFFKLSSGLNPTGKIDFNPDEYLLEMSSILESYKDNRTTFVGTHPVNPIRLKALEHFSNSKQFKDIINNNVIGVDNELNNKVNDLASYLLILDSSEVAVHRSFFLVTGGLIVSGIDEAIGEKELEHIVSVLSSAQLFPMKFINGIMEFSKDEIMEFFIKSVQEILKINPGERFLMLDYLISVALVDRKIMESEIKLIYEIGEKILGISVKEIAQLIVKNIREGFVPKFF